MVERRELLHRAAAGALAAALPAARAAGDRAAQPSVALAGYRLVQDWDFVRDIRDGQALFREFHTRFVYERGQLDHLNDEWSRYRELDNHRFTPQGLSLVAYADGAAAPGRVYSGMLRSRWVGQFGLFEARLQVPRGRGLWPAFWLNPQDGRWPPEIDVVEIVDNGRDTTRHSFHFVHGDEAATDKRITSSRLDAHQRHAPGFDYADGFHDFAVEWTPEAVRHFVDGQLVVARRYRWRHDDGSDGGPAHVLLNLAVGGKWPGTPAPAALPAELRVAHIRVWQR